MSDAYGPSAEELSETEAEDFLAEQMASVQPTTDASDERVVRARQKNAEKKALQEAAERKGMWKAILADAVGRREVWGLVHKAFTCEFAVSPAGMPDNSATMYQRGIHDEAFALWRALFAIDPVGIVLMHKEHDPLFNTVPPRRRANG